MYGSNRFAGQSIVITGGSKGIGRATAERFAQEGAKNIIITASSDTHATTETMDAIRKF